MIHLQTFTFGSFAVHNYLIWHPDHKEAVLIDSGKHPQPVIDMVRAKGLTLKAICYTHAHIDHVEGQAELREAFPEVVTYAHPEATFWIEGLDGQAAAFQLEPSGPVSVDQWVQHHQMLTFAGFTLEARHAPGHAPESLVYWCPQLNALFAGDVIFYRSIGRTDFPRGDHGQLLDSIAREVMSLPDAVVIYSGHGPTTTVGQERLQNPFLVPSPA
jgi:hydroxyacylglutathione hydrolase